MTTIDIETGEVMPNGAVAASSAASAKVQMERDRVAHGNQYIQDSIKRAVEKMPVWITTDKSGAHRIKYATLKAILEVVRPPLLSEGVRIRQGAEKSWPMDEGAGSKGRLVPVYTDLVHILSGQYERTTIEIPMTKLDAQSMGSAITYGRRYSLLAALGLATDEADDDGAAAMPHDVTRRVETSSELGALKSEIDKLKDPSELAKWGNDAKTKRRVNTLSEAEAVLLREHYSEHGRKLIGAAE